MPLSRSELDAMQPSSRSIHAGSTVRLGDAQPTAPPIHVATAFTYPTTEELDAVFADNSSGYVYSRFGNPTVKALEEAVAAIEGTDDAVAYGSGMAAIHGIVAALARPGSTVIASRDVYGATHALLGGYLADNGVKTIFVDIRDLDGLESLAREHKPSLIFAETVSNPLMRVANVQRIATIAHGADAKFVLDNTFATPIVTRAVALGADAVVYSSTKHYGGHGDTTGGLVATSDEITHKLREQNKLIGAIAAPFDAWLVLRGLRTLDLRVRKQSANAAEIVTWLTRDGRVASVNFPGLQSDLPVGQFCDGLHGTMLSFEIRGAGRDEVFRFQDALRLIQPATTLGDIASLVLHPATSSHRGLTPEQRAEIGIADGLVRVSAGIEDARDIVADLDQAMNAALTR
ncbi:MAG: PLP-dependent aspartate aminotransferase family protein [Chloroflexota bacterium]|nr:PLP-dependent aspartate aminotransferase family protein [Chloroflexota bacterium]